MVGGTSIGSFVGGLWAAHRHMDLLRDKMILFSSDMGSYVSKILDLTYPLTSMFSGASFNKAIHQIFEDIQIEVSEYFTGSSSSSSSSSWFKYLQAFLNGYTHYLAVELLSEMLK